MTPQPSDRHDAPAPPPGGVFALAGDGGTPGDVSALQFREAMSSLATAVSVVSTAGPGGVAGVTCSAVCAVSDAPPLLLVCLHAQGAANAVIKANRVLCVNCLHAGQTALSQLFAGAGRVPMAERFAAGGWDTLLTGSPYCREALVAFDCAVLEAREVGTHSMFVGKVLATAQGAAADPLIYHRRNYATRTPL